MRYRKYELLTQMKKSRNTNKEAELFISPANKNFSKFSEKLYKENENEVTFKYAKRDSSGKFLNWERSIPKVFNFPLNEGYMPNVNNSDFQAIYHFLKPRR